MARGKAARAERDARIYTLAVGGSTERQIAAEVGLSPARVHDIIAEEIGRRVGPPAEEYATRREAELHDLWTRAYSILADPTKDADMQLKALTTALRVNESRRKLRGVDAPEALAVRLDHRVDEETTVVVEAVLAAVRAVGLDGERRTYALEAAVGKLRAIEGEDAEYTEPKPLPPEVGPCVPYTEDGALFFDGPPGTSIRYRVVATERKPSPVVTQLALPPGRSTDKAQQRDGVDAVLSALADFEAEFGSLDSEEDGTAGTGSNSPESDGTAGTGTEGA